MWCVGNPPLYVESIVKWVNTLLGNVESALTGIFHAFDLKHAARYLAEFEYRCNRRFELGAMLEQFSSAALSALPMPYRFISWLSFMRNQVMFSLYLIYLIRRVAVTARRVQVTEPFWASALLSLHAAQRLAVARLPIPSFVC